MYSQPYKRYVTVLMLVAYIFSQADRGVFEFLMEPIKRDLRLTDTQLGFLDGPALVVFYVTLGVPIARFADRGRRVGVMAVSIASWSVAVMLSSIVSRFWQLSLTRVGVGIGEAGFTAIAQSLIADYHSAAERTRALAIFMLAIPLGLVVSSLIGGWVNQLSGWRSAFVLAGVPGVPLALLLWRTVREPARIDTPMPTMARQGQPSLLTVIGTLWRRRTLLYLLFGCAFANLLTASSLSWLPTFFVRIHGMTTGEVGAWFAPMVCCGGVLGTWLGGYLTNDHGSRDPRVQMWLLAASTALGALAVVTLLLSPSKSVALLLLFPVSILIHFFFAPTFSLVQSLGSPNMRATLAAIFVLVQVTLGGIIGIQLVGFLSDVFSSSLGVNALRWAVIIVAPAGFLSAAFFLLSAGHVRRDLAVLGASEASYDRVSEVSP